MLGAGENVGVIKQSVENIKEAMDEDGILRMNFKNKNSKSSSFKNMQYPTPYADVRLEHDYRRKYAFECDLTFWAVQLIHMCEK